MIQVNVTGSFKQLEQFCRNVSRMDIPAILRRYGQIGVTALATHTPAETGLAAASWGYEVLVEKGFYTISWTNSDVEGGFPVVVMLQFGYATGTGGYVHGRDFINPAMKPIFDKIADEVWRVVTSA